MTLSRRSFLGGLAAVTALATTLKASSALSSAAEWVPPRLHGDGFADDAPYFQALFDGKEVVPDERITVFRDAIGIGPGTYCMTSTVTVGGGIVMKGE
jgi:hypothetical protein